MIIKVEDSKFWLTTENNLHGFEISELEHINFSVAVIHGWTDFEEWNPSPKDDKPVRVYQGTNEAHPELGKFIPNYVESLDAIIKLFRVFEIPFDFAYSPNADLENEAFIAWSRLAYRQEANSPAIALCKLLLAINPTPISAPQTTFEVEFV